jgi:phage shock protein C
MTNGEPRRLYKDRDNAMIAGIAAGIADYFDLDPTLVRIAFVLLAVFGGSGLIIYLVLLFVVPDKPANAATMEAPGAPIEAPAPPELVEEPESAAVAEDSGAEEAPEAEAMDDAGGPAEDLGSDDLLRKAREDLEE